MFRFALLVLALLSLLALVSAHGTHCRSSERLVLSGVTRPGPFGGEHQLARALAVNQLLKVILSRFEQAGVCYFAIGHTLEGVLKHEALLPYHAHVVDLAIESSSILLAQKALLMALDGHDDYLLVQRPDDLALKVSVLIEGKVSGHVNLFVYTHTNGKLIHPWQTHQPDYTSVFPTKLAPFRGGFIRVPADAKAFFHNHAKTFSWAQMAWLSSTANGHPSAEFPLVSVIIPTFERPQFLAKAIELVWRQDYPNLEIVIVDDGRISQSHNPLIAAALAAPGVRYVHLDQRHSIGAKRNIAVELTRGEIVVHWDDDDYFREHRISAQVAPILRGDVDMTVLEHHYYLVLSTQTFYTVRRPSTWGPHFGTFVYRRSLFAEAGLRYPDNSMAEDYAFAEFALDRGATIQVLSNEDGKHVYVRHHNTWKFDLTDFGDDAINRVDRPTFVADNDWAHLSTVYSAPVDEPAPNSWSSEQVHWGRPELRPSWADNPSPAYGPVYGSPVADSQANPPPWPSAPDATKPPLESPTDSKPPSFWARLKSWWNSLWSWWTSIVHKLSTLTTSPSIITAA